jgi:predicted nuclease of predicted toxin-antitoxin system
VRFLIDENLSPRICTSLIASGHGATHVRDHGMASATDSQVLAKAATDGLVLITADRGDFGRELALTRAVEPSVPHDCCGVGAEQRSICRAHSNSSTRPTPPAALNRERIPPQRASMDHTTVPASSMRCGGMMTNPLATRSPSAQGIRTSAALYGM